MRFAQFTAFNAASSAAAIQSAAMDATQRIACSAQVKFSDSAAAGTFKFQVSNDAANPSNWSDTGVSSASATVSSGATALISISEANFIPCRWIRLSWTPTNAGVQTVALVADVAGSLNNTYFLLGDEASQHKFYVWFNINSAGTDPALAGRTGIEVDGATGATAATLGAAMATAIAAANSSGSFTTSGTSTVTITNKQVGPFTPITDGPGPAATLFTFAVTGGNGTMTANFESEGM